MNENLLQQQRVKRLLRRRGWTLDFFPNNDAVAKAKLAL